MAVDSFRNRRSGDAGPIRRRWRSAVCLGACAGALAVLVAGCGDANPNYRGDYTDTTPGPIPAPTVSMTAQPQQPEYLPPPVASVPTTVVPSTTRTPVTPLTSAPAATGSPVS